MSTKTKPPAKLGGLRFKNAVTPWLFILPGLVFTFIFRYYTTFQAFWISLHDYDVAEPPGDFIGFENYIALFKNADFWSAWKNTLIFTVLSLLITFFIPIIQALFLNEVRRGRGMFTTLYLIPTMIPLSINVIIWKWIFNPNYGLANAIVTFFGGEPQTWYSDPTLTKLCIILPGILGGGFSVLMYLSAIMGVDRDIYEAADIDGCYGFKRLWYITLPNIRFLIMIQMILAVIGAMQILDQPLQYTTGGPNGASTSIALHINNLMVENVNYGKAAASGVILLVVIAIITAVEMKLDKSEKK